MSILHTSLRQREGARCEDGIRRVRVVCEKICLRMCEDARVCRGAIARPPQRRQSRDESPSCATEVVNAKGRQGDGEQPRQERRNLAEGTTQYVNGSKSVVKGPWRGGL